MRLRNVKGSSEIIDKSSYILKDYLKYKELANEPKMVRVGSTDSLPHPNNNKKKGCC